MSASIILALMAIAKMKSMATSANAIQAFLDKTVTFKLLVQLKIWIIKLSRTDATISRTPFHIISPLIEDSARLYFLEMEDFLSPRIWRHWKKFTRWLRTISIEMFGSLESGILTKMERSHSKAMVQQFTIQFHFSPFHLVERITLMKAMV